MIGVLVKKNGRVLEKNAYQGDVTKSLELIEKERQKRPALEFHVYNEKDLDWEEFTGAALEPERTPLQQEWDAIKGKQSEAILFLGKILGLE